MTGVFVCSHNITSPLGFTSEENFNRIVAGNSGVQVQQRKDIDIYSFYASLFNDVQIKDIDSAPEELTLFEKIIIRSVEEAAGRVTIDLTSPRTIFIFSTTKG